MMTLFCCHELVQSYDCQLLQTDVKHFRVMIRKIESKEWNELFIKTSNKTSLPTLTVDNPWVATPEQAIHNR